MATVSTVKSMFYSTGSSKVPRRLLQCHFFKWHLCQGRHPLLLSGALRSPPSALVQRKSTQPEERVEMRSNGQMQLNQENQYIQFTQQSLTSVSWN